MTGYACPGCSGAMERRAFPRRPEGKVEVDLCFMCHGAWFDPHESSILAPAGVIALFSAIHERQGESARPLGDSLRCPACPRTLVLTHDLQRTTRFTYFRCPSGDGRFTTFYQFLREKSFVRELSATEVTRLRATIAQVKCSSCGGAIDLARDAACPYCHMPIAVLDADAVKTALADLAQAERQRHQVDPLAPMQAALAGQRVARRLAASEGRGAWGSWSPVGGDVTGLGVDLVASAIDFLMSD